MTGVAIDELRRLVDARRRAPVVVDLCTGSGAVALAMATEAAGSVVVARRGVGGRRVRTPCATPRGSAAEVPYDLADAATSLTRSTTWPGRVHVVDGQSAVHPARRPGSRVDAEARDHDPAVALWSGEDGLDAIAVVAEVAARLLVDGGLVRVRARRRAGGVGTRGVRRHGAWREVRDNRDLAGRPRFVSARRVPRQPRPRWHDGLVSRRTAAPTRTSRPGRGQPTATPTTSSPTTSRHRGRR